MFDIDYKNFADLYSRCLKWAVKLSLVKCNWCLPLVKYYSIFCLWMWYKTQPFMVYLSKYSEFVITLLTNMNSNFEIKVGEPMYLYEENIGIYIQIESIIDHIITQYKFVYDNSKLTDDPNEKFIVEISSDKDIATINIETVDETERFTITDEEEVPKDKNIRELYSEVTNLFYKIIRDHFINLIKFSKDLVLRDIDSNPN